MMISSVDVLVDVATGLIVVILLWAGIAKLRSTDRTLKAMKDLGTPRLLQHRWVARLVPLIEIVLGLLLLCAPGPIRVVGSIFAAMMFGAFTFYISRAVARGEEVSCECFGSASHSPVDRLTITRNVLLLILALMATGSGRDGSILLFSLDPIRLICLVIAAIIGSLIGVIVNQRRHMERLRMVINNGADRYRRGSDDPLTGSPIPDVEVVSISGTTRTLPQLPNGRAALLIFAKAGCGDCSRLIESFANWGPRLNSAVRTLFITSSDPEALFSEHPAIVDHTYFGASAAREALGVRMLPTAVLLAADGKSVATEVVEGSSAIADLAVALEEAASINDHASQPPQT